jgi:hypothetical protein
MNTEPSISESPTHDAILESRFRELAEQWKKETRFCSSTTKLVDHPAYQAIIQLGKAVIPLILEELRAEPRHWFPALQAITGENPVAPEDRGVVRKMTTAWLEWGRSRGL